MTGDRWTLLVVRGEQSPIRQFTLSPRRLRVAAGGLAAVALVITGLAGYVVRDATIRLEARRLESENATLSAEFERVQTRVAELEGTIAFLSEKDSSLRVMAGLETIDEEVLQVGVGGPGFATPENHPLWGIDSVVSKSAFAVNYDLNVLERRARLLSESLDEANDSLLAHRDLLESTPSILPTSGLLSSQFSRSRFHPIHHRALPHEGVDISATGGTPILAAAKGTVVVAEWAAGYGLMVEIDHGYGYTTRYGHASKALVHVGQTVQRAEVIGLVGSTGIATAPHLHYEVRINGKPQNPLNFVLPGAVP